MRGPLQKPLRLPEWSAQLPDDACLSANELFAAIGIKKGCIKLLCANDRAPPPDYDARGFKNNGYCKPTHYWRLGTLRAHLKKQEIK